MNSDEDWRAYPSRPIVGVLAVVLKANKFLLICRGKPPNLGAWGFPGGVQKTGETIFECAMRELVEETSVIANHPRILLPFDMIDRDPDGSAKYHFLLVPVVLEWRSGSGAATLEAPELGWFGEDQVSALPIVLPMVRDIMAAARRL